MLTRTQVQDVHKYTTRTQQATTTHLNNSHDKFRMPSLDIVTTCGIQVQVGERRRCSNEAKARNRLKFAGCPKLVNRSQPIVGRSSPYCEDIIWMRYGCLISFFPIVDTCLSCEDTAEQRCEMVPRWRIFGDFLRPAFPSIRVQNVSCLLYTSDAADE